MLASPVEREPELAEEALEDFTRGLLYVVPVTEG
jgi:hypothetical protein